MMTLSAYQQAYDTSRVAKELKMVRNVKPLLTKFGNFLGTLLGGAEMWMRTLENRPAFYAEPRQARLCLIEKSRMSASRLTIPSPMALWLLTNYHRCFCRLPIMRKTSRRI